MMRQFTLGLMLLLLCMPAIAQQTPDSEKDRQYVTDQLRLSLYEGTNSQSKVLKLLVSGDTVLIEECRPLSRHKRWRMKAITHRAA